MPAVNGLEEEEEDDGGDDGGEDDDLESCPFDEGSTTRDAGSWAVLAMYVEK